MRLRRPVLCFIVVLFSISPKVYAQYYFYDDKYYDKPVVFEIGMSAGGMNCFTDLGGKKGKGGKFMKDFNFRNTQLCGSIYFSIVYQDIISLRMEGGYGQVKAYDSILKKAAASTSGRYERNLSFRSSIREIMVAIEIHPVYLFVKHDDNRQPPLVSPYVLAGIGSFKFNPQTKMDNTWVDLQPLHTEGEGFSKYPGRKEYKLSQLNVPVGLGIKYELSSIINIRAEIIYRVLKTDYLDDVSTAYIDPAEFQNNLTGTKLNQALSLNKRSTNTTVWKTDPGSQRGDPNTNDSYFSFNLKIGLTIGREKIKR